MDLKMDKNVAYCETITMARSNILTLLLLNLAIAYYSQVFILRAWNSKLIWLSLVYLPQIATTISALLALCNSDR